MARQPRAAVVTGGSSGIGFAVARALAAAGWRLAVVGYDAGRSAEAARALGDGHLGLALDVTREDDMRVMVARALDRFGRIDLLVASAGTGRRRGSERTMPYPTDSLPLDEWRAVLDVNLTGVFLSNRSVLPAMIAAGRGHIVNVCSSTTPHGLRGRPLAQAYSASKFAVVGFSRALAAEVADHGVRVDVLHPGAVATPLVRDTLLAQPFGGAMASDSFAAAVLGLVELPPRIRVPQPHVIPFRGGLRRARAR